MQINNKLVSKIESLINGISLTDISVARQELTSLYKNKKSSLNPLTSNRLHLAYLIARFPATYAVIYQVLMEMVRHYGRQPVQSLLDIGSGPGTVLLAALEAGLPLTSATMIERDPGFVRLGKELVETSFEEQWICQDITKELKVVPNDLVIASYCLGELSAGDLMQTIEKLWRLTNKILIIIEPGTQTGFESIKQMRENLISKGGFLVAPCPHSEQCPMQKKDWCHFSARVERSSLHRKIKDATLNYEDEKFCYLIFSKNKVEPCQQRVIRHPFIGSGFINLQLCSKNGIEKKTITKKNKPQFSYARKIKWGDDFNFSELK